MATNYSNLYVLNPDGRTYTVINDPNNLRNGEGVWVRALVSLPAGTVATDIALFAPVSAGVRPLYGLITATATNGSLTGTLGYTSSVSAIASLATEIQSNTATLLTPAQLKAVTVLPVAGDNLILTLAGTFTNPTVIGVAIHFVNCGS